MSKRQCWFYRWQASFKDRNGPEIESLLQDVQGYSNNARAKGDAISTGSPLPQVITANERQYPQV